LERRIGPLERAGGGFAKNVESPHDSTYMTFLVAVCRELVGSPAGSPGSVIAWTKARQRSDGGFVEMAPLDAGGTNPTAAAVALLQMFGGLDAPCRIALIDFLSRMQNIEGGFRAHAKIPAADLLSTFTGLTALADIEGLDVARLEALRRYVLSLEDRGGGFRAGALDDEVDVEYTFYGLAALSLLATFAPEL
jgi:geranylgeranyl transferase type-2 subunit beta